MKIMSCRTGYATDHSSSTYEFLVLTDSVVIKGTVSPGHSGDDVVS